MKILFVNPFGIGDILFTTPLIKSLKERSDFISYWCNERVVDILKYNKSIKAIFPLSRGDIKRIFKTSPCEAIKKLIDLIIKIKKERFDVALDFSLDYRYSLLLRVLGIKRIVGFNYKGRGRFLTDKININGFANRHMFEHYAMLLKFVDTSIQIYNRIELFIGENEKEWADKLLRNNGINPSDTLIGITPGGGASWGDSAFRKHWPKENFAYIADELMLTDGYKIILFGDEKEENICNFIADSMKKRPLNLCGKTGLGQFAAILQRCKLLITNDGGPLHMASALGVKTVSIFGPVDEIVYGPYPSSRDHTVITSDVECRPCYKNFKYSFCKDRICLDSIEPRIVLEAARRTIRTMYDSRD